jgi:hypothetical protein
VDSKWIVCGGVRNGFPIIRADGTCECRCHNGSRSAECSGTPAPFSSPPAITPPTPPPVVCTLCEVGSWSEWSKCDFDCDGGLSERRRKLVVPQRGCSSPCAKKA